MSLGIIVNRVGGSACAIVLSHESISWAGEWAGLLMGVWVLTAIWEES